MYSPKTRLIIIGPQPLITSCISFRVSSSCFFDTTFSLKALSQSPCCDSVSLCYIIISRYVIALVHHKMLFIYNETVHYFFFPRGASFWICVMRRVHQG